MKLEKFYEAGIVVNIAHTLKFFDSTFHLESLRANRIQVTTQYVKKGKHFGQIQPLFPRENYVGLEKTGKKFIWKEIVMNCQRFCDSWILTKCVMNFSPKISFH